MRNKYSAHFPKSDVEIKEIWKDGQFVFDTNVLLDLYRHSEVARSDFFKILKSLGPQIWIPEQVAREFFRNRFEVIKKQVELYDSTKKQLLDVNEKLVKSVSHPFVSAGSLEKLEEVVKGIDGELDSAKKNLESYFSRDPIAEEISTHFFNKIGDSLNGEELDGVFEEGRERYARKCPPGYMDVGKSSEDDDSEDAKRRRFGDLILWKQVISRIKEVQKPLVFITAERKEDWWLKVGGKTIGPRTEMVEELKREAGQEMLLYSSYKFVAYAKEEIAKGVSSETVDEYQDHAKLLRQALALRQSESLLSDNDDASEHWPRELMGRVVREANHALHGSGGSAPIDQLLSIDGIDGLDTALRYRPLSGADLEQVERDILMDIARKQHKLERLASIEAMEQSSEDRREHRKRLRELEIDLEETRDALKRFTASVPRPRSHKMRHRSLRPLRERKPTDD